MSSITITGIILLCFLIISLILLVLTFVSDKIDLVKLFSVWLLFAGIMSTALFYTHILIIRATNKIHPIDVYRGNTMLRIEYQNGIPSDTTVVWKDVDKIEYQYE